MLAGVEAEQLRRENETLRARVAELEARRSLDDVSDRDALNLILAVSTALQTTVGTPLNACLREICTHTGWVLGEAWMMDRNSGRLVAAHLRAGTMSDNIRAFINSSRDVSFAIGEGLPGRVFASRQREWIPDVATAPIEQYLRLHEARSAGIHAALAVPVLAGDESLGVLVFYLDRSQPEDLRRVELVTAVAAQLGLILKQREADARIEKLESKTVELSTPVIEVWPKVALAPVIGELDRRRVEHLRDRVLAFVGEHHARAVLLDVTGAGEIDDAIAHDLIEIARATRMLGAVVVLTGMRPGLARALVHYGVSMSEVTSEATLAAGLRDAMEHVTLPVHQRVGVPRDG